MKTYVIQLNDEIKKGDLIRIDSIKGQKLFIEIIDLSKGQVRIGPKFKDNKPDKKDK